MTKLETKLRTRLHNLGIGRSEKILVAVSGGADSTALLDALARWKGNLCVAHLNHMLRGEESNNDEKFVREWAQRFGLEVFIENAQVAIEAETLKKNLEATARQIRYEFLYRIARQVSAKIIFTAHTQDDQIETILMRLLRGSSAVGLRGIHSIIEIEKNLRLIRPMLEITRAEVLDHCNFYRLKFCCDSSNNSLDYTRNRIRHELIPLMKSFNPNLAEVLVRLAAQLSEDDDFLRHKSAKLLKDNSENGSLKFFPLIDLHPAIRRRVLRQWLKENRGDLRRITTSHLKSLENLIVNGEGNQYIELPGKWKVLRQGKTLKLQPN